MPRGRGHPRAAVTAALVLFAPSYFSAGSSLADVHDASAHAAILDDDECMAQAAEGEDAATARQRCGMNALQLRASQALDAHAVDGETAERSLDMLLQEHHMTVDGMRALTDEERKIASGIWHYALPCYSQCGAKSGYCSSYCGEGNACCKYLNSADPPECHTVRFWPITYTATCVAVSYDMRGATTIAPDYSSFERPSPTPSMINGVPAPASLVFANPLLFKPSDAPVMKFYVYRVQSDENYAPENQNMGNIPGMLWYLHNEIVWHPSLKRTGTYFSTSKTRLEKFRIMVRPTQPLHQLGMNFGVVNAFDSTMCTGPYGCNNFREFGYAVGCETWVPHSGSDFPHGQWTSQNKYPNAVWYSLPGPCPTKKLDQKDAQCIASEPGGACVMGGIPSGTGDCTYTYEKVGEVSINELEGIEDAAHFVAQGGIEYNKWTDKGTGTSFWDGKGDAEACKRRVELTEALFKKKYAEQEDLPDPVCDFNRWKLETAMSKAGAMGR